MKIIRIFKYDIFLSYTLIQRKFLCTIYLIQTIDFNWTKSNPSFFNIRKLEFDQVKITYCLVNPLKNIYKPHLLLQLKLGIKHSIFSQIFDEDQSNKIDFLLSKKDCPKYSINETFANTFEHYS